MAFAPFTGHVFYCSWVSPFSLLAAFTSCRFSHSRLFPTLDTTEVTHPSLVLPCPRSAFLPPAGDQAFGSTMSNPASNCLQPDNLTMVIVSASASTVVLLSQGLMPRFFYTDSGQFSPPFHSTTMLLDVASQTCYILHKLTAQLCLYVHQQLFFKLLTGCDFAEEFHHEEHLAVKESKQRSLKVLRVHWAMESTQGSDFYIQKAIHPLFQPGIEAIKVGYCAYPTEETADISQYSGCGLWSGTHGVKDDQEQSALSLKVMGGCSHGYQWPILSV
eukprot:Gb_02511 [translate_table: standard]